MEIQTTLSRIQIQVIDAVSYKDNHCVWCISMYFHEYTCVWVLFYATFEIPLTWLALFSKNFFRQLKLFFSLPSGRSKIAMKRVSSNIEKGKTDSFYNPKVCHWRFENYLEWPTMTFVNSLVFCLTPDDCQNIWLKKRELHPQNILQSSKEDSTNRI